MLYDSSCNTCDRRDCDGVGHCYRIEAVINMIDMMAIVMKVMDIVIGLKL